MSVKNIDDYFDNPRHDPFLYHEWYKIKNDLEQCVNEVCNGKINYKKKS